MFKKPWHYLLCSLVLTLIFAGPMASEAFAGASVGDLIKIRNRAGHGTNGEFEVYHDENAYYLDAAYNPNPAAAVEDFRTFCVEGGNAVEYFTPGEVLYVAGLGIATLSSATPTGLPVLTKEVAALYREFTKSALTGYTRNFFGLAGVNYTSNNTDGDLLQTAMWALMAPAEVTLPALGTNRFYDAVTTNAGVIAAFVTPLGATFGGDIGGVQIMNLKAGSKTGNNRQDQIVYNGPDFVLEVPEPSTLALFGIGFVGAVCYRRRRVSVAV